MVRGKLLVKKLAKPRGMGERMESISVVLTAGRSLRLVIYGDVSTRTT